MMCVCVYVCVCACVCWGTGSGSIEPYLGSPLSYFLGSQVFILFYFFFLFLFSQAYISKQNEFENNNT